jgi:DNA uptake protein ComE-like DNA-binding protein
MNESPRPPHAEPLEIDLNEASEELLATLPTVGPEGARALVAARPFWSWDEVARVPGLSVAALDALKTAGAIIGARA